jgi:hypothetical protein
MILGLKAGVITLDSVDRDIVVKIASLEDSVSPDILSNLIIQTKV